MIADEEEEIDEAVKLAEDLELERLQEAKKKKKKILKERKKIHERLNLKMIIKDDEPIIDEDLELFRLSQIRNRKVYFIVLNIYFERFINFLKLYKSQHHVLLIFFLLIL